MMNPIEFKFFNVNSSREHPHVVAQALRNVAFELTEESCLGDMFLKPVLSIP